MAAGRRSVPAPPLGACSISVVASRLALTLAAVAPCVARADWQNFTTAQGLPNNRAYTIFEASDGAMWFGTPAGAARYDGQLWSTIAAPPLPNNTVRSLVEDRRGRWWFGTESGGIARLDGA